MVYMKVAGTVFRQTMPLKYKLKSKEEIPAGQESLYVERDGAVILDADGAVEKSKLDECF